jgi:hypothetical protein
MKRLSFLTLFAGLPFFGAGAATAARKDAIGGVVPYPTRVVRSCGIDWNVVCSPRSVVPLPNGTSIPVSGTSYIGESINVDPAFAGSGEFFDLRCPLSASMNSPKILKGGEWFKIDSANFKHPAYTIAGTDSADDFIGFGNEEAVA